jgi:hypothetical protein
VHRWREALEATEGRYEETSEVYGEYGGGVPGYPGSSLRMERLEPQLVPVPVHGGVERVETWFEVVRRVRHRTPRY